MSRAIWKFNLPIDDTSVAVMPEHAIPLAVAEQHGALYLWAEVDESAPIAQREFHIRGTGHPLRGNEGKYIGTVVMTGGLVWHVFNDGIKARKREVQ
jgi:hypothetical protein